MLFRRYKLFIVVNNLGNNISNDVYCDTVNRFHQGIPSECRTVFPYVHICNFTYAHNKRTAIPAPSFMKLTDAQWYYKHKSYSEFHPNLIMIAGSMEIYQFTTLCEVWLSLHQFS